MVLLLVFIVNPYTKPYSQTRFSPIAHWIWYVSQPELSSSYLQMNMWGFTTKSPCRTLPFCLSPSVCVARALWNSSRTNFWSKRICKVTVVLMWASSSDLTASVLCVSTNTHHLSHNTPRHTWTLVLEPIRYLQWSVQSHRQSCQCKCISIYSVTSVIFTFRVTEQQFVSHQTLSSSRKLLVVIVGILETHYTRLLFYVWCELTHQLTFSHDVLVPLVTTV